jgi:hypothetical protein
MFSDMCEKLAVESGVVRFDSGVWHTVLDAGADDTISSSSISEVLKLSTCNSLHRLKSDLVLNSTVELQPTALHSFSVMLA